MSGFETFANMSQSYAPRLDDVKVGHVHVRSGDSEVVLKCPSEQEVGRFLEASRSRNRWTPEGQKRLQAQAFEALKELSGADDVDLVRLLELIRTGHVEVHLHSDDDLAIRAPWEALLARGTANLREGSTFVVSRVLADVQPREPRPKQRPIFVASSPRWLSDAYGFEDELLLVKTGLDADVHAPGTPVDQVKLPADTTLVHLAGVDAEQAARWLALLRTRDPTVGDNGADEALAGKQGFVIGSARHRSGLAVIEWADLAAQLSGASPPEIVCCNFFNSSQVCAKMVRAGVGAALGFVDEIDDSVAEVLFGEFYRALGYQRQQHKCARCAFERAWYQLMKLELSGFVGTGVVLWRAPTANAGEHKDCLVGLDHQETVLLKPDQHGKAVVVRATPHASLNYSVLHNNGGIWHDFRILTTRIGTTRPITVRSRLHLGSGVFEHVDQQSLSRPVTNLTRQIRVPLTSELARSLRESVRTNLTVEVLAGDEPLFVRTHSVVMLAIDEWRNRGSARALLPSFVLPRDPTVARLIGEATRYLRAISDCRRACFVGYGTPAWSSASLGTVEMQARAIWLTLAQQWQFDYIRPPPTYSADSQRIRTPTEMLETRQGTCLDYALLFAACLEHIEVNALLVLGESGSERHAWCGYWRDAGAHKSFSKEAAADGVVRVPGNLRDSGQLHAWELTDSAAFQKLKDEETVTLIDTARLTGHEDPNASFVAATGARRLTKFECMLDIAHARSFDVTPLPILEARR